MKKKIIRIALFTLLLGLTVLALLVLYPRHYVVAEFKPRAGTEYWDLPTGSRIGYFHLAAKGSRSTTPIVYLHGGPGGHISDGHIAALSPLADDGYDLYFYDQIGSGHSARLENIAEYTVDRHVRDLEVIVERIGAEKVILIGQSWGALLATQYVAAHPDHVSQLILTGPGPILPVRKELADVIAPDSLHLRKPMVTNREGNAKVANLRTRAVQWWALAFESKLASDAEADNFQTYLSGELGKSTVCDKANAKAATGGDGYYASIMTVGSFAEVPDSRPQLQGCKVPLLIMKGQCDNQPWGFAQEYLELFADHRLVVIPNAGHSIAAEQPELYIRTIREYLVERSGLERAVE